MNLRHLVPLFSLFLIATAATAANAAPALPPLPPLPEPVRTEQHQPVPPVVSAPANAAPSDAIVLFNGSATALAANWESTDRANPAPRWTLEPASRAVVVAPKTGDLRTKAAFGDMQLHIEWRSPAAVDPKNTGQARGNSGVFFMGLYELQVLDSFENDTYVNGQAGSIYKQFPPLVNASRRPGEWQTYDAVFIAPRFNADGALVSPARLTVFHNGVLIQHDTVLRGGTEFRGLPRYVAHAARLPLTLQNHAGDLVAFRNIWVRELTFPLAPPVPDIPPPPYAPAKKIKN
jgi:hypothetical protein